MATIAAVGQISTIGTLTGLKRNPSATFLDADTQLIERCLGGEEAAWEDLVKIHARRVYAICYRFVGSDQEAQDLTQEVFLRVFRSLKSFRAGEGSFRVWLARLTRNLLIDHYRRTKLDRSTDSIEGQLPMLEEKIAISARADGLVAGREASERLQAALQKLSPELRETVILRDLEELEYREVAQVLNVPEGTVKSRLNRGRAELARILRRENMNCLDVEIQLADYLDGTLAADRKFAFESHLSSCAACRQLSRDAVDALAFMERVSDVTAPPELVTRILFEISSGPSHSLVKPSSWLRRVLEPVLQPRYAMGMAMTVLSFAMLSQFAGIEVRHLDPVKVWTAAEDRASRSWERGVKYYESLRMVNEIESRVKEWSDESTDVANSTAPAFPSSE